MPRFELTEGGSNKYWEITRDGLSVTTHWGRIGTAGQSKTKTFATEAAAQHEHDGLVAEKVKKGYKPAEPPSGGAAPGATTPPVAKTRGQRADFYVYNEATAFVITSMALAARGAQPGDEAWGGLVRDGAILPVELVQDDSFVLRVVVEEDTKPEESAEWVGRLRARLRLDDGKLVVAGGIELVTEDLEGGRDYLRDLDALRELDVPPGTYDAELLAFVHGVNGSYLLQRAAPETLVGQWWRATRPRRKPPAWVRRRCASDPSEDPGHEEEWADAEEEDDSEAKPHVDFLLHLRRSDAPGSVTPAVDAGGFFGLDAFESRKPDPCPAGIEALRLVRNPKKPHVPPPPPPAVDVLTRVGDRELVALAGGAVALPIVKLIHAYRLAYFSTSPADPLIRLTLPPGTSFAIDRKDLDTLAAPETRDDVLHIGFSECGARFGHLHDVRCVGEQLPALPDGTVVELLTAPEPDPDQADGMGIHRYRGSVQGGVWRIDSTYPKLEAETLRDALGIAACLDGDGRPVALRDEEEGRRALLLSEDDRVVFRTNPIVVKGGAMGLRDPDASLLHWIGTYVFRIRWSGVWPHWKESEEDAAARKVLSAKLQASANNLAQTLARAAAVKQPLELLLEGKVGRFDAIDLRRERPGEAKAIDNCDRQMAEIGLTPVGDIVCSRFSEVLMRTYTSPDGDTWATFYCGVLESTFDFVTQFVNGGGLTTSMNPHGPLDEPDRRLYRTRCDDVNFFLLRRLHERHTARKEELLPTHGPAVRTSLALVDFARAVDRGVALQLAID